MARLVILGGTGQIGSAVGRAFGEAGHDVTVVSRRAEGPTGPWRHVSADRENPDDLRRVLGPGADMVLDCVAFDASHAEQLLAYQSGIGHLVVVSSASVYRDAEGRTLDEAVETGFPHFPVPIPEDHPTTAPGPETYSTRKVALEERLLDGADVPLTILRPCAIHGPESSHAREWWIVKRLLDGRDRIPLAFMGESRFQTTSTRAIAEAVGQALVRKGQAIENVTDADAPNVAEIAGTIMAHLGRSATLVGLPPGPWPPEQGMTPWSTERPLVCASARPGSGTYAETVGPALDWLVRATEGRDWREVLPQLAAYPRDHFDYDADDEALTTPGAVALPA